MEPLLVFLSTAVGTVVGVACAVLMMQKRNRLPATEGGAAGKVSPQNLASVVAAPMVTIDDVRKLLAERDQTLQQSRDDLQTKQQQLDVATAAAESAAALCAEAEQRSNELAIQASAFTDQMRELAAKTKEESLVAEEAGRQVAALESQLDLEKQQGRELTEQIARLTSELTGYRVAGAEAVAQLESQLDLEKKQGRELAEQATVLTIDLTQARQSSAEAEGYRSSLEAELGVGRLRIMQLTDRVAELSRDRSEFETRLREERQSAARGIELLSLAQSTLSGAFHRLHEDGQNLDGATARGSARVAKTEVGEGFPVRREMDDLVPEPSADSLAVSA